MIDTAWLRERRAAMSPHARLEFRFEDEIPRDDLVSNVRVACFAGEDLRWWGRLLAHIGAVRRARR